jgi:hypothetical protein
MGDAIVNFHISPLARGRGNEVSEGEGELLPRRLAQRFVDAVLPARAVFLKEIEHVAVDAQRNHFLGPGKRWRAHPVIAAGSFDLD